MDFNFILQNGAALLTAIGILSFLVSIITEFTKGWKFLARIPTDAQVLTISILVSVLGTIIYVQMQKAAMVWYYIVGALILGFIVAFVAMYGWEKLTELWKRFKK